MILTKKRSIKHRIFDIESLKRIARIFEEQCLLAKKAKHHHSLKYEVAFTDDTTIEGEEIKLLDADIVTSQKPPMYVRFRFHNYKTDREMSFQVTHGSGHVPFSNIVTVSGEEKWVNDVYQKLENLINSTPPQTSFYTKHPTLLLNIIALGVGTTAVWILAAALIPLGVNRDSLPEWVHKSYNFIWSIIPPFIFIWVTRWASGFFAAPYIRQWILKNWPSIELDFGAEHLKKEKRNRRIIDYSVKALLVPILLTAVWDFIKTL